VRICGTASRLSIESDQKRLILNFQQRNFNAEEVHQPEQGENGSIANSFHFSADFVN